MVLFASMANGTSAATFGKRKPTYDSLIGKFDALRLQAIARPVPRLPGAQIFARGGGLLANPEKLQSPTPDFLAAVILTLAFMSEADAEFDLRPSDVKRFKNEFEASMSQALTYEKALER
jgi:hypothetical protein